MSFLLKKGGHHPDYSIIIIFFLLIIFGLVMLVSASSDIGKDRFNDSYYFIKNQLVKGFLVGLVGFIFGYFINYRNYKNWALLIFIISFVLLLLIFTNFGLSKGGAERWLRVGPISFQPAELMKISYIIYMAAWLSNVKFNRNKGLYEGFIPFLVISGIVGGVLFLQPATSTVLILLSSGLTMYTLSGAPLKYIILAIACGLLVVSVLVILTPYRFNRIIGFLQSAEDQYNLGYHSRQAQIAIGSGQIWGVGYGQSTSKINLLPDPVADSIFAVIGQEFGFVGSTTVVIIFAFLAIKILWMAKNFRDNFGRFILIGFGVIIAAQAFVHMASISGIIPLTGVPLPFISYGGTALAVFMTMAGIIANISKYA